MSCGGLVEMEPVSGLQDNDGSQSVSFSQLSVSASDMHFITSLEGGKMVLNFATDNTEGHYPSELYQPLFDWIDPDLHMYTLEKAQTACYVSGNSKVADMVNQLQMPCLAIVLFLRDDSFVGDEMVTQAKEHFNSPPWKFHHSETVSRGKINACPFNKQDYYVAGNDSPLCAIRQVHCGKQLLRLVRFVSSANWKDCINFYSLVLAQEPDMVKSDFCLFTTGSQDNYDIQLALKRVPKGIECRSIATSTLCFRITQVGHVVPLLPNVCTCTSEVRWETVDPDGNRVNFEVIRSQAHEDNVAASPVKHRTPLQTTHHRIKHHVQSDTMSRSSINCSISEEGQYEIEDDTTQSQSDIYTSDYDEVSGLSVSNQDSHDDNRFDHYHLTGLSVNNKDSHNDNKYENYDVMGLHVRDQDSYSDDSFDHLDVTGLNVRSQDSQNDNKFDHYDVTGLNASSQNSHKENKFGHYDVTGLNASSQNSHKDNKFAHYDVTGLNANSQNSHNDNRYGRTRLNVSSGGNQDSHIDINHAHYDAIELCVSNKDSYRHSPGDDQAIDDEQIFHEECVDTPYNEPYIVHNPHNIDNYQSDSAESFQTCSTQYHEIQHKQPQILPRVSAKLGFFV